MERKGRSEHLRYRYGICLNDGCSKCKSKEVQQIAARKEFVCAERGKPLRECPPPKSWWDKNGKMVIGLIVLAAVIAGVVLYFVLGGGKGKTPKRLSDDDTTEVKVDTTKAGQDDGIDSTSIKKQDEGKEEGNDKVKEPTAKPKTNPRPVTPPTPPKPKVNPKYGTVNLGYGTYTGDLKNGKPHGRGVITYRTTHRIVDSKDFVANPGDSFDGDFRDGRISGQGYWYHDGNQTVVKP